MKDDAYAYAVARIRANERNLLTDKDIQALIDCKSFGEAVDLLVSKNWAQKSADKFSIAKAIGENQKKLWALLCESVPEKEKLRVFTVQNDFFNLKAALKCMLTVKDPNELFAFPTSLDLKSVDAAVKNHDFSLLDPDFAQALKEAYEAAVQTQSGQNADIILDRAAVIYIEKLASQSKCELVEEISAFLCAAAVLKTAVRCARTQKSLSFAQSAIAPCKMLDSDMLAKLSVQGEEALLSYLENTDFSFGAKLLCESSSAFEKWCDDMIVEKSKKAKFIFFGFEPICAYYFAKQAEIKTVRIILTSKQSGIPEEKIKERIRALYV